MIPIFNSLTAALAAALFVATVLLVTKKRLKEEFALVWLAASIVVMATSLEPRILRSIAQPLGLGGDHQSLVIVVAILFFLLVCMHLSVRLSAMDVRLRRVAQQVAIDSFRLEYMSEPEIPRYQSRESSGKNSHLGKDNENPDDK